LKWKIELLRPALGNGSSGDGNIQLQAATLSSGYSNFIHWPCRSRWLGWDILIPGRQLEEALYPCSDQRGIWRWRYAVFWGSSARSCRSASQPGSSCIDQWGRPRWFSFR